LFSRADIASNFRSVSKSVPNTFLSDPVVLLVGSSVQLMRRSRQRLQTFIVIFWNWKLYYFTSNTFITSADNAA